jgi:hypothetical protein
MSSSLIVTGQLLLLVTLNVINWGILIPPITQAGGVLVNEVVIEEVGCAKATDIQPAITVAVDKNLLNNCFTMGYYF